MKGVLLIGLLVAAGFDASFARDIPEFLHVCKRNDPQLSECVKQSVRYLQPKLSSGLPDYNIPSLEPLFLKEVSTNGANIKLKLKDLDVYGASNFTVSRLKINLDTLRLYIELNIPNISLKGMYDVDGKVILLTLKGSGPMVGDFMNCKGFVKIQAELTKDKNGDNYLRISDFKTKISVGQGSLKLDNLFGGDPVLGEAVNTAINSNFDAFLQDLQPSIEKALSDTFLKIANSILSQFTYDQLFPVS